MTTARVIYHFEDGAWWAESPDVPRWSAAGDSYAEVRRLAEEGIPFATERDDWDLRHVADPALLPYLPYFGVGAVVTVGAIARVALAASTGITVSAEAPRAGVAREQELCIA